MVIEVIFLGTWGFVIKYAVVEEEGGGAAEAVISHDMH